MKKFLAITLTLALTLALFAFPIPANAAVTTQTETNVLFEDDFSDYEGDYTSGLPIKNLMIANGWNSTSSNTQAIYAATGSYISPIGVAETNMVTSLENTADWSGYAVSSDISFTNVFATTEEEARVATSAVVVLNATQLDGGGYEVGLHLAADDTKKVIIRHRGVSTLAEKEYSFNTDGTVYRIKAEYIAGTINCYVNGTLELSYNTSNDDVMLTKGSAGFRKVGTKGNSAEITFDNFKVEKTEKTVWFSEDFTYGEADTINSITGLSDADVASIKQNGALSIDFNSAHNYLINTSGTEAWNDYSVEADFTMTRNSETTQTGWFGLSGRMKNGSGYEFTIMVTNNAKNTISARIRQLGPNGTKAQSDECYVFQSGSTYNIKLEFVDNTVNGYINDNLVCSYVDETNHSTCGTVGINIAQKENCSVDVVIDNLEVTGYAPVTEYLNQNFDNVTAAELFKAGYQTNLTGGISAYAESYIAEGKISLPTEAKQVGIFSPTINSNNYTVEVDLTITSTQANATTFGILIGAPNAEYKSCSFLEVNSVKAGNISYLRYRKIDETGSVVADETLTNSNITSSNRPPMGTPTTLTVNVSYNEESQQSTIIFTVTCNETVRDTLTKTVSGTLSGKVGLYKPAAQGSCSFYNFRIYPNTISDYVSPTIGELDGDGIVTVADGRYIREYLLGLNDATAADLNADTESDIRDLVHFKKVFEFYR